MRERQESLNEWVANIHQYLPLWAFPSNEGDAMRWFYEGLPEGQEVPFDVWLIPLAWTLSLILAIYFMCFAIVVVFRRQWVEHERLIFPLMIFGGLVGGSLWALIPAILKSRFNTNEILVSLMLVYIAEQALASASIGLLRNPEGSGFPGSRNLNQYPSASNPELIENSGIHWGVIFSFLAVWFFYYLLKNHKFGFQIKLFGDAPKAASFAGLKPEYIILLCFSISGALAGVAGMFELTGPAGAITIDFNVGYGFTAIIVAFLGRLNPIGILFAGLLMALTYVGGEISQFMLGIPAAAIQVFQGMLLFFLLSIDLIVKFRVSLNFTQSKFTSRKE